MTKNLEQIGSGEEMMCNWLVYLRNKTKRSIQLSGHRYFLPRGRRVQDKRTKKILV